MRWWLMEGRRSNGMLQESDQVMASCILMKGLTA
jgi:hypothetical protein